MSNALMEKMLKAGSVKAANVLSESNFFNQKDSIPTKIKALNIALSGRIDGGVSPGLTVVAGPSRHFKTSFCLVMLKAYLDQYPDAICLFYDTEFGAPMGYFKTFGIDLNRVLHIPIEHIEQLKFDCVKRLEEIKRGDKVIIFLDSLGTLASKKEIEDAINDKAVADMTRAKAIRSLFRIITPTLTMKDLPCLVVNHVYQTLEMYAKTVMSGGTAVTYSANTVLFIGRQQEKEEQELTGYNFVITVDKSRFVKEKSQISVRVSFKGGIDPFSGLFDNAVEAGFIIKPKVGWYALKSEPEKSYRKAQFNNPEMWDHIFAEYPFAEWLSEKYSLGMGEATTLGEVEFEEEFAEETEE